MFMKTKEMKRRCQVSGITSRLQITGLGDESRAQGIANPTGAAECCAAILAAGLVACVNQICEVLALTPCIPVDYRETTEKKMLKRGVRSRNVYENKGNMDTSPDENSDIFVQTTRL